MPADPRITFVEFCAVDRDAYRAGVLLTDGATNPLEFRCTDAVCPTVTQKLLWGARLISHVSTEVLGKPLIDSLTSRVDVVLTRQELLLPLRSLVTIPVVQLLSAPHGNDCSPLPGSTLFLRATNGHADDIEATVALLAEAACLADLLEPFDRVKQAVQVAHEQCLSAQTV
jgi:hypothetical protein